MIKSPGKEFLGIALQSGNVHHAICSSPVKDAFLDMVQKHSSSSTGMPYWRTCVTSESLEAGTYQSLSMLPLLSCLELDDDTPKVQETIEKVKRSVSDPENRFAAAHHYYNLAEIMIAKGLMTEALTCANEGYWLRNELLLECFTIEWEGETVETNKHVCKTFYPNPSRFSSVGSYCVGKNVPTPWNLLRCYFDSALQNGTLHHMIGYSCEAENMLYHGKEICSIQNFPVFSVGFSIALGNVHCKEKHWSSATKELDSARKSLDVCSRNLCKKCILVLKVKINQLEGDINLSILKNKGDNAKDALRKAKDSFEKAKSNLENEEWVNSVSRPERETPKENNPVLCYSNEKSDKECWHCQTSIIEQSSSLEDLTNLKWEVIRRRYLLQVVTKLAKLSKLEEDVNEERKLLMEGIYVLVGRSTFEKLELSSSFVEKLVREKVVAKALGAEQASILYKTCCFSLRHEESREKAILSRENVLLGLKMAFVQSREVPKVHEKVSQTLAVVYACSSKDVSHSELQRVNEIQSASYFHQCSIGSHFNSRFLSQDQNPMEVDGSSDLRRVLAPHSVKELEESISCFFKILSKILPESVTVLCMSMLSDKSYGTLQIFLPEGHPASAWLMISRFHLKIGPNVVILPISEKLKAFPCPKDNNSTCKWSCPWAGNTFDEVAPVLRWVLEEDDKLTNRGQKLHEMMKKRLKLDGILGDFLRNLEDSWLGPWKYFLLGKCSGDDNVDTLTIEMDQELKSNFGCYIGKINKTVKKKVPDANKKKCRDPIVIVSQLDIQMIPFESLPVLQEQEVYRMPSVGSILQSISNNKVFYRNKKLTGCHLSDSFESLPVLQEQEVYKNRVVNPCNCYYLIKQDDEDFVEIIKCFEEWSKTFDIEGKAGNVVKISVDELKKALESHELFIWVGHGDGTQYIPETEIRKISNCCAAILMGCSSGFVYSRNHAMEGAPLDYLLAGSSVVIANLWTVYTSGIISFTKKLFETWIKSTSSDRIKCKERKLLKRKFTGTSLCEHESNLGSSMAKARAACKRRYLDGATSVIYGIPTRIAETSHSVPEEPGGGRGKEMKRPVSFLELSGATNSTFIPFVHEDVTTLCLHRPTNLSLSSIDASVKGTICYLESRLLVYTRLAVDDRYGEEQCSLVKWAKDCVKDQKLDQMVDSKKCDSSAESAGIMNFTSKIHKYLASASKPKSDQSGTSLRKRLEGNMNQSSMINKDGNYHGEIPRQHDELVTRKLKIFTYGELEFATLNFCSSSTGLSYQCNETVYSVTTYFSFAGYTGQPIAVRRIDDYKHFDLEMFKQFHHPNLIQLIGYCLNREDLLLVYEHIHYEDLARLLSWGNIARLPLVTRIKIAVGIARGISFLEKAQLQVRKRKHTNFRSRLDRQNIFVYEDFTVKISGYETPMLVHGFPPHDIGESYQVI
ncbi:separase isoform X1, partial [Tanacetum coccineum]